MSAQPRLAEPDPRQPQELADRPIQFQGSTLAHWLLRAAGWQLDWNGVPAAQGVVAVYPHTSNWDFPIGLLAKWAMGMPMKFLGKHSLFEVPLFGRWMRWVGGLPVDRRAAHGLVGDMVQRLQQARQRNELFWLVIAPEGTRSLTPGWRSGFYRMAVQAGVPLALAHLDWGRKRVGFHSFIELTGDPDVDMAEVARRLGDARGARPALAAPIRLC